MRIMPALSNEANVDALNRGVLILRQLLRPINFFAFVSRMKPSSLARFRPPFGTPLTKRSNLELAQLMRSQIIKSRKTFTLFLLLLSTNFIVKRSAVGFYTPLFSLHHHAHTLHVFINLSHSKIQHFFNVRILFFKNTLSRRL